MSVSPNTQAILLLTAHFSKSAKDAARPLTPKEWGRFALWLKDRSLTPERFMHGDLPDLLEGWSDGKVTLPRLQALMDRGSALALAMDKWLGAGLWVMTRSDPDYPARMKRRLGTDAPAVVFGCGNRALLGGGGLAVVGSRKTSDSDLEFSRALGALAAGSGYSIVSGGARGVDEAAMLGALEAEGTVVGVLADSLLRASTSAKYRRHLMAGNLALVSPYNPEAGFNAGNAMQRNKYVYCLSDAAMVVHSGRKGGTWNGALENLERRWVPLWVKRTNDEAAGNAALVRAGGAWAAGNIDEIAITELLTRDLGRGSTQEDAFERSTAEHIEERAESYSPATRDHAADMAFYDFFLLKVEGPCRAAPRTVDELVNLLLVSKGQLNIWLKRAVAEEKVTKLKKPVRYEWNVARQASLSL